MRSSQEGKVRLRPTERIDPSTWSPHVVRALCQRIPGGRHPKTLACEACGSVFFPCLCSTRTTPKLRSNPEKLIAPRIVELAECARLNPQAVNCGHLSLVHDETDHDMDSTRIVVVGAFHQGEGQCADQDRVAPCRGHVVRRRGADYIFSQDGQKQLFQEIDFNTQELSKLFDGSAGSIDGNNKVIPGVRVLKTVSVVYESTEDSKNDLELEYQLDTWVVRRVIQTTQRASRAWEVVVRGLIEGKKGSKHDQKTQQLLRAWEAGVCRLIEEKKEQRLRAWEAGVRQGHTLLFMIVGKREFDMSRTSYMPSMFVAKRGALNQGDSSSEDEDLSDADEYAKSELWPCTLEFNMLPAGWKLVPMLLSKQLTFENPYLENNSKFEVSLLRKGSKAWLDGSVVYCNIPDEMLGATFVTANLSSYKRATCHIGNMTASSPLDITLLPWAEGIDDSTFSATLEGTLYVWAETSGADIGLSPEWEHIAQQMRDVNSDSVFHVFKRSIKPCVRIKLPAFVSHQGLQSPLCVAFQRKVGSLARLHFVCMPQEVISRKGLSVRHAHIYESVLDTCKGKVDDSCKVEVSISAQKVNELMYSRKNDVKILVEWGIRSGLTPAQLDFTFNRIFLQLSKEISLFNTKARDFVDMLLMKSQRFIDAISQEIFKSGSGTEQFSSRQIHMAENFQGELQEIFRLMPIGYLRDLSTACVEEAARMEGYIASAAQRRSALVSAKKLVEALNFARLKAPDQLAASQPSATIRAVTSPSLPSHTPDRMGSKTQLGNTRSHCSAGDSHAQDDAMDERGNSERFESLGLNLVRAHQRNSDEVAVSGTLVLLYLHIQCDAFVNSRMSSEADEVPDWAMKSAAQNRSVNNETCEEQHLRRQQKRQEKIKDPDARRMDGRLSLKDFKEVLLACGITWFSESEIKDKFNAMDLDRSGYLSLEELLSCTYRMKEFVAAFRDYEMDVRTEYDRLKLQMEPRMVLLQAFADQLSLGDDLVGSTKAPSVADKLIRSSTYVRDSDSATKYAAWNSRLDSPHTAWVAECKDKKPWLQWNFTSKVCVCAVVTRAHPKLPCWVRWYRLAYREKKAKSCSWKPWPDPKRFSEGKLPEGHRMMKEGQMDYVCLEGNHHPKSTAGHSLSIVSQVRTLCETMPHTKQVRLYPVDWQSEAPYGASLRVTLLGYIVPSH